jgi:hypothetical protein
LPNLGSNTPQLNVDSFDFGYEVETFPSWACDAAGTILTTAGAVFGSALVVRRKVTITNLVANITVAGGTLTANDCWGLLYNSAGTLLGQSANQATLWATAGLQTMALTASSTGSLTLTPGLYWGGVVATGTTLPTFSRSAMGGASVALAAAQYNAQFSASLARCGVLATSITTTPAAITPANITKATGIPLWFGLV